MTKTTIARRYALALYRLLDPGNVEAARVGLHALCQALKDSSALAHVLASPAFTVSEKTGILTELGERTGCPPVVGRFCEQLLKKSRMGALPDVTEAFQRVVDQQRGKQHVAVVSAHGIDDALKHDVLTRLRSTLRTEVDVDFQSDPSLIAGVQIKIGSKVYDGSIKSRLRKMRAQLMKEPALSHEGPSEPRRADSSLRSG